MPLGKIGELRRVLKLWKSYLDRQLFARKFIARYGPTFLISFNCLFEPDRLFLPKHLFGLDGKLDPNFDLSCWIAPPPLGSTFCNMNSAIPNFCTYLLACTRRISIYRAWRAASTRDKSPGYGTL
ncbi:hypothetical protein NL676_037846 [Syzygium grande]|nr:hypothetical protein NL676_037846 [Syzygium grande]